MAGDIKNIHKGHRGRMRDKFIIHGERVFQSYELLEMLMFSVIPCVNTNPKAKLLFEAFGSVDGILSASDKELLGVGGIGEKTVKMIRSIDAFSNCLSETIENGVIERFDDYHKLGEMIIGKMKGEKTNKVVLLLFNSDMDLVGEELMYEFDYGSAAVRSDAFVSSAVRHNASVAVIAHNHPFGPLFPTSSDLATNVLISGALLSAGVTLLEHYVVSGESYVGFMDNLNSAFEQSLNIKRFLKSKAYGNG